MKYSILTFGCRTNQADSFDIERELRAQGAREAPVESADLIVVNTCAVTSTAEQAARQAIRRVRRLNAAARVVATGCYAARAPGELRALTAEIWPRQTTNDQRPTTPDQRPTTTDQRPTTTDQRPTTNNQQPTTMPPPGTGGRTVHLLRVQTGCDEHCAYCVVPLTRGRSRSVPIRAVLDGVARAAAAGFKEITITGVHLGSYGRDLEPANSLGQLLLALAADPSDARFRISAVEPMDVDDEVIGAVRDARRFAPHFHLPLQHASDRMLSAMQRPYTLDRYRRVVDAVLDACPDAAVGTDLIVGFPGETEADFRACAEYLAGSPLAYAHVFPFSPRPGTAAASMSGRPRGEEVRRRVTDLRAMAAARNREYRARFVGSVRDGLTIEDGSLVVTGNYLRVRIAGGLPRNERVKVRIVADGEPMIGELIF